MNRRRDTLLRPLAQDTRVPFDESQIQILPQIILSQLRTAGIRRPRIFELFPSQPVTVHDAKSNTDNHYDGVSGKDIVVGFVPRWDFQKDLQLVLPNRVGDPACSSSKIQDYMQLYRIIAALHETGHYVAYKLGLNDSVTRAVMKNYGDLQPDKLMEDKVRMFLLKANIKERIADTAATLYALSNYKGEMVDVVLDMSRDFREAIPETQHHTTSSIVVAQQDFARHPVYGMTIVEATKRAAELISKQSGLLEDVIASKRKYEMLVGLGVFEQETQKGLAVLKAVPNVSVMKSVLEMGGFAFPRALDPNEDFTSQSQARDRLCSVKPKDQNKTDTIAPAIGP